MKKVLCLVLVLILAIPVVGLAAPKMEMDKKTKTLFLNADNKTNTSDTYNFNIKNKGTGYKNKYTFTWSTDDEDIINVTKGGVVTAKKVGTAIVKCVVKLKKTGKVKITCKATVTVKANAETVKITNAPEDNEIEVGNTFNFNLTMRAANGGQATDKTEWSVSKEKIGTIDKNGVFTAKKAGEVEIYCKTYQSAATKSKGYTAQSEPVTITVYEKRPSGLSGVAPSALGGSDGKIEGTTAKMEYDVETEFTNPKDCSEGETTGLTAGEYYVRYEKTKKKKASDYTTVVIPDGKAGELTGTVEITGEEKFGETLAATVKDTNNTGKLSYQWKRAGENIEGATESKYKLVEADIGKTLSCVVKSDKEEGLITSAATGTIEKASGPEAPEGLKGVAPSNYGGTNGKITGTTALMEYSKTEDFANATDCGAENTTGLSAGTYYVRYKETATHKAGKSASVKVPDGEYWDEPYVDATVSPATATFDMDTNLSDYGDKTFTLTTGSYSLVGIKYGNGYLSINTDYTVNGNEYTILIKKLAVLGEGEHSFMFDMSGGTDPVVTITVNDSRPRITGTVTINETPKFGTELTANVNSNCTDTLLYQWKRGGENGVSIGTGNKYTIKIEDISSTITCVVTSENYSGSIFKTTDVVSKADQLNAPTGLAGVAPSEFGVADGSITGTTKSMEYSSSEDFERKDNCSDEKTEGLIAGDYYVRYKETDTYNASTHIKVNVPYGLSKLEGKVTIVDEPLPIRKLLTVNINCNTTTEGATVFYQWKYGDEPYTEISKESTYTLKEDDLGHKIACDVSIEGWSGVISGVTSTVVVEEEETEPSESPTTSPSTSVVNLQLYRDLDIYYTRRRNVSE